MNLNDLKFAKTRLNLFDEILQEQLNKPFIIQHSGWFTSLLAVIALVAICYNVFTWPGIIAWVKHYCCFLKEPREPNEKCKFFK